MYKNPLILRNHSEIKPLNSKSQSDPFESESGNSLVQVRPPLPLMNN